MCMCISAWRASGSAGWMSMRRLVGGDMARTTFFAFQMVPSKVFTVAPELSCSIDLTRVPMWMRSRIGAVQRSSSSSMPQDR